MPPHYAHFAGEMSANMRYYTQQQQQQQQQQMRQWHVPNHQHHPMAHAQPLGNSMSPTPVHIQPICPQLAQAWLQNAMADLQTAPLRIVPAINPKYHLTRRQGLERLYLPRLAWNVRSLLPHGRQELFVQLREYGRIMRDNHPVSAEYACAFQLIIEKSIEIYRQEVMWYTWFVNTRNGSLAQRLETFRTIRAQQAQPTDVCNVVPESHVRGSMVTPSTQHSLNQNQAGSSRETALTIDDDKSLEAKDVGSGPTPSRGKKWPTPHADPEKAPPAAKKAKTEADGMFQAEVSGMTKEDRDAKAKADHQRYLDHQEIIDQHYLKDDGARKSTDPEWQKLAVWDTHLANVSAKPKPKQPRSRRQDKSYNTDAVKCPVLPSRDLASYPMKQGDTEDVSVSLGESGSRLGKSLMPNLELPSQTQDDMDSLFGGDDDVEMGLARDNRPSIEQEDAMIQTNESDDLDAPEAWFQRAVLEAFCGMPDDP